MRKTANSIVLTWLLGACGSGSGGGPGGEGSSTGGAAGSSTVPGSGGGISGGGSLGTGGTSAGGAPAPTSGTSAGGTSSGGAATGGGTAAGGATAATGGTSSGGAPVTTGGSEPSGGRTAGTAGMATGGTGTAQGGAGGMAGVSGSSGAGGSGGTTSAPDPACVEMVDAAKTFLQSLDAAKRMTASLAWDDSKRLALEFLPPNQAPRQALTLKGLAAPQRMAFETFLQKAMSVPGYTKTERIRQLEVALGTPPVRDPENYFISFFGEPSASATTPWGFRFEGHHISIHTSVVACKTYATTPAFWGASGYTAASMNPLATEESLAKTLFDSLTSAQKTEAGRGATGISAIEDKQRKTAPYPADAGVAASGLSTAQKETLRQLIQTYVGNMNATMAAQRMQAIDAAGFDALRFVFGTGGYYRVQGPTFVIVFAPEGANHIHSIWRDFDGDWGEDLLARHLEQMHAPQPAPEHKAAGRHHHVSGHAHLDGRPHVHRH